MPQYNLQFVRRDPMRRIVEWCAAENIVCNFIIRWPPVCADEDNTTFTYPSEMLGLLRRWNDMWDIDLVISEEDAVLLRIMFGNVLDDC